MSFFQWGKGIQLRMLHHHLSSILVAVIADTRSVFSLRDQSEGRILFEQRFPTTISQLEDLHPGLQLLCMARSQYLESLCRVAYCMERYSFGCNPKPCLRSSLRVD